MHGFREQGHPYGRHWSDEFQKIRTSFSENPAPAFCGPVCHPSTFIDLAIFALASKNSVKTIWSVWESHSTQRGATGAWNFKKKMGHFFWRKLLLGFFCPSCHPSTFIDLENTVLANRCSVKTICTV